MREPERSLLGDRGSIDVGANDEEEDEEGLLLLEKEG